MKRSTFGAALLLVLCLSLNNRSIAQDYLTARLDSLFLDTLFQSSSAALSIYDLTDNKPLYSRNERVLLHPASNMKILTTSAGLLFLGPDYKFNTVFRYTGTIADSTIYGDIYIEGGGDPDFSTKDLDSVIGAIKQQGIRRITGNIYADVSMMDSLFWGQGWMWDDDPSTDAPYLSPLNINSNNVIVTVEPGIEGYPAIVKTIPESEYFTIINSSKTVKKISKDFFLERAWVNRGNNIIVKGDYSINQGSIAKEMNVYNPPAYFLSLFKEKLRTAHIHFTGKTDTARIPDKTTRLFTFSRPYREVIVNLNKQSDNLSAEMTLHALAVKYMGKPATAENGIMLVDSMITLLGLNPDKFRLVDGSGVSHYNLLTSGLILEVLKYMYYSKPELYHILYESFPIGGIDGTLSRRLKNGPAFANVHAKTGSFSGVSSLSGYITSAKGNLIAFSILVQNFVGTSTYARDFQDKVCHILADYR